MGENKFFRWGEFVIREINNSVLFGFAMLPNRCWKRNLSFRLFLVESSRSFRSSMVAIYLQNRMKSKKDRNCLTSCHSARSLLFKNVINDLLFSISSHINARSIFGV